MLLPPANTPKFPPLAEVLTIENAVCNVSAFPILTTASPNPVLFPSTLSLLLPKDRAPTPTFPALVVILPIVLELNVAARPPLVMKIDAVVIPVDALKVPVDTWVNMPFVENSPALVIPVLNRNVAEEIEVPTAFVMFKFVVVTDVPFAFVKVIDGLVMLEVSITLLPLNVAVEIVVAFPLVRIILLVVIADADIFVKSAEGAVIPVFKTTVFPFNVPVDVLVDIAFTLLIVPATSNV